MPEIEQPHSTFDTTDTNIQYINNANVQLKNKSSILRTNTNKLKSKLETFRNII